MEVTQTITALACNNDFHSCILLIVSKIKDDKFFLDKFISDLLFTAGSNKTIQVYDMNTTQVVRTLYDPHDRVVNCIALNKVTTVCK